MRRWLSLLAISLSTFILLVDLTVVSVAASAIVLGLVRSPIPSDQSPAQDDVAASGRHG